MRGSAVTNQTEFLEKFRTLNVWSNAHKPAQPLPGPLSDHRSTLPVSIVGRLLQ